MKRKEPADAQSYLFEKMFFQAAHIAILEEALATAKNDLKRLAVEHPGLELSSELEKIEIAYRSIDKLKKGTMI